MSETSSAIDPTIITQDISPSPVVRENEKVEKPKRQGVSDTIRGYTETKTRGAKPLLEREMQERAVSVARNGAKAVRKDVEALFPNDIATEAIQQPERSGEYAQLLVQEQMKILEGQNEKIDRMVQFVTQMNEWSNALIAEFTVAEKQRTDIAVEEVAANILRYQNEIQNLVVEATRTITYQDIKASAVTLGDHGWMHLTQDLRDSLSIATLKRGQDLNSREKFMLGLASAFHDIGYAVPEVSDPQRNNKGKYGSFDKGHPINSYVYLVAQRGKYESILGQEAADALFQIVANHENPEKAERAGKFSDLAEAFALADASAAFGQDKLPPIVTQIPEVLPYLNAVRLGSSIEKFEAIYDQINEDIPIEEALELFQSEVVQKLKDIAIAKIDDKIGHKPTTTEDSAEDTNIDALLYQSEALKNAIDHFSALSLSFLLGRMSAESGPLQVTSDKKVEFTINAGFARQLKARGVIANTIEESATLTVKLFLEQASLDISDKSLVKVLIDCVAKNELPTLEISEKLQEQGITIDVTTDDDGSTVDRSVRLESEKIVVISRTDAGISEQNMDFYNGISHHLDVANQETGNFIQKHKKQGVAS